MKRSVNSAVIMLLCTSLRVASLSAGVAQAGGNLMIKPSKYSVRETIDRIEKAVTAKGMKALPVLTMAENRRKWD